MKIVLSLFLAVSLFAVERMTMLMGTYVTVEAPTFGQTQKAFEIIKKIENSLSTFKKDSLVYRLNEKKCVKPDRCLYDIIKKSLFMNGITEGYFDVAVGRITKDIYRFGTDERLPRSSLKNVSVDLNISLSNEKICIPKNIKLDFGGIAKGYAVDEVAAYFRKQHLEHALIALSGDIRCFGRCHIAIDSPFSEGSIAVVYNDHDKEFAISTSGIYRRYVQDQKHNHIINPYTKKPQSKIVSLTLFGKQPNYFYDAMATAIVAMGKAQALRYLKRAGVAFILVTSDGKLYLQRKNYKIALVESALQINSFDNDKEQVKRKTKKSERGKKL